MQQSARWTDGDNLGIQSPLSQDLSLALGSSSVTLTELTSAYGVFANQGIWNKPYTITTVQDANGESLEQMVPVRLLDRVGFKPVAGVAHALGINSPLSFDLSLALGSKTAARYKTVR